MSSDAATDNRIGESRSATSIGGKKNFCQYLYSYLNPGHNFANLDDHLNAVKLHLLQS